MNYPGLPHKPNKTFSFEHSPFSRFLEMHQTIETAKPVITITQVPINICIFSPIGKCKAQMEIHGNAKLKKAPRSVQCKSIQFNSTQTQTHEAHKSVVVVELVSEHLNSDTEPQATLPLPHTPYPRLSTISNNYLPSFAIEDN